MAFFSAAIISYAWCILYQALTSSLTAADCDFLNSPVHLMSVQLHLPCHAGQSVHPVKSAVSVRLQGAVRFRHQLRGRTEFRIFLCYRGQHILEGNILQSLEYVVHFSSNVHVTT